MSHHLARGADRAISSIPPRGDDSAAPSVTASDAKPGEDIQTQIVIRTCTAAAMPVIVRNRGEHPPPPKVSREAHHTHLPIGDGGLATHQPALGSDEAPTSHQTVADSTETGRRSQPVG